MRVRRVLGRDRASAAAPRSCAGSGLGTARVLPAHAPGTRRRHSMKTVLHVVGARPNYMKIAPLMDALNNVPGLRQVLVNTGQHYDEAMAKGFIRELSLPMPDRDLDVRSASHGVQTANIMARFDTVCEEERPDMIVVVGDVNSTMAAALVGAKRLIPVAH